MSSPLESPKGFLRRFVFSTDHKVVGLQYLFLALAAVTIGIVLSLLMRFHLVWPAAHLPFVGSGIMTPEQYLALVTMHGTIMVFFVLTVAPQGAFGNYFLPIQIGAPDMAFPRLNMLSFWLTLLAFLCVLAAFAVPGGAPISGWTAYPPLSGLGEVTGPGEGMGQTIWIVSILIFCVASLLGSLNFISTTIDMRAPGMTLMRMPLTVWAWFVTSILSLLAFSVLLAGGILLLLDRSAGTSFFLPAGLVVNGEMQGHSGGSPLLWQHLFWFFGHPEVYIAILAGNGRRFARAGEFFAQARVRISSDGARALRHRLSRLSGVGPPHVCERHESLFGAHVFVADDFDRRALRDQDVQLAGDALGRKDPASNADAFRDRLRFVLHYRRPFRNFPGAARRGHDASRDVLRRGAFSHRDGRRGDLWNFRGDLLLVPENVRPQHERNPRETAFLAYVCRASTASSCRCTLSASPAEFAATRIRPARNIWPRFSRFTNL